jgi:hypothetical protein
LSRSSLTTPHIIIELINPINNTITPKTIPADCTEQGKVKRVNELREATSELREATSALREATTRHQGRW